ncbi:hypothetical protein [Candidatus Poriferisocius sp.]|uniref:hypothetical protein n=1 Tax=Candidatus Poriferisocius sp. TaxID=3101276 RepID=UPI003B01BBE7
MEKVSLDQETIEKINSYETSIVDLYDDEVERTLARNAAAEAEGVPIAKWNEVVGAEDGEAEGQEGQKAAPEAEGAEAGTDDKKADEGEKTPELTELEQARQERDAAQQRLMEMEREEAVRSSETKIREEISEKIKDKVAAVEKLNAADAKKLAEFEENYGPEAAEEMREALDAAKKARLAEIDSEREAELARARSERDEVIDAASRNQADVDALPELKQWQQDAVAFYEGDESRSPAAWNLATSIDQALMKSPEWKDRPQPERFAEVARMVKASGGAPSPGSPPAQTDNAGKSDEQIARELAAKDARAKASTGLQTISDITGGATPDALPERLESMGAGELRDAFDSGRLSMGAMEKAAAKLLEE